MDFEALAFMAAQNLPIEASFDRSKAGWLGVAASDGSWYMATPAKGVAETGQYKVPGSAMKGKGTKVSLSGRVLTVTSGRSRSSFPLVESRINENPAAAPYDLGKFDVPKTVRDLLKKTPKDGVLAVYSDYVALGTTSSLIILPTDWGSELESPLVIRADNFDKLLKWYKCDKGSLGKPMPDRLVLRQGETIACISRVYSVQFNKESIDNLLARDWSDVTPVFDWEAMDDVSRIDAQLEFNNTNDGGEVVAFTKDGSGSSQAPLPRRVPMPFRINYTDVAWLPKLNEPIKVKQSEHVMRFDVGGFSVIKAIELL